ncbi:hypothetical protein Zmor_016101 [Zophobas morio]|uniref:TLDc domain-containing protein n=1 Tax=Zophobas morio TaxID=2755281 RepID=A0AA38MI89_9CUCU|nr:hypothetical protein Zmor_016101 [Zophobas morio]
MFVNYEAVNEIVLGTGCVLGMGLLGFNYYNQAFIYIMLASGIITVSKGCLLLYGIRKENWVCVMIHMVLTAIALIVGKIVVTFLGVVLYRTAMAILILFHKASSSPSSEWMTEIQRNGIDAALNKFCKEMPVTPQKLLKVAFGIRGLSSAYISRVFIRTEMVLKSKNVINGSRQLVRSRSSENLPNSQSQNNIQMVSHTLTIRELLTLWSWLPVRITMYQPILLYTTEEHGCSLTTFYVRVEHHEPTLLMIKTCNNEVFGAYCSSRWGERNQKDDRGNRQAYFGTGETFLFSLYPERAKYQWVGIEGDKVGHGAELFMAADSKMITIGGG